jgi:hypothetical protein
MCGLVLGDGGSDGDGQAVGVGLISVLDKVLRAVKWKAEE